MNRVHVNGDNGGDDENDADADDDCFFSWAWILAHQLPVEPVGGRGGILGVNLIFPTKYVIPKSLNSAIGQVSFCNNFQQIILQFLFDSFFSGWT